MRCHLKPKEQAWAAASLRRGTLVRKTKFQSLLLEAEEQRGCLPFWLLPVPNPGLVYLMPIARHKVWVVLMLIVVLISIFVKLICSPEVSVS